MSDPILNIRTLWVLGLIAASFGVSPEASAQTDKVQDTQVAVKNNASLALEAARSGALARRNGEIVKACSSFERAVELTPTWAVAQMELGRCYRLLGDPKGVARSHLELALKWLPKWSLVHIELGRIAEDQRMPKIAGEYYAQAEQLAAADIRAAGGSARLAPASSPAAKLVRLRRIIQRQPNNLALLGELAKLAESISALDEAERALRTIVKLSRYPKRSAARLVRFGKRTGRSEAVPTS